MACNHRTRLQTAISINYVEIIRGEVSSIIQTRRERDIKAQQHQLSNLLKSIQSKIIGQHHLIENMLVCLLADGHILIEGMPGLAKTRSAKAIADGIEGDFHRIQFTPDLLPSDLIGTEIYIHDKSHFIFRKGPLFNNILLADEINRAPARCSRPFLRRWKKSR